MMPTPPPLVRMASRSLRGVMLWPRVSAASNSSPRPATRTSPARAKAAS